MKEKATISEARAFSTPEGQYALREGHGWDFYASCCSAGYLLTMAGTDDMIARMKSSRYSMETDPDQRLRDKIAEHIPMIEAREQELTDKYLRRK